MVPPLPADVLIAIFGHVNVRDITNLRRTCKFFLEITQTHSVWRSLFLKHVLEPNLPVPGFNQRDIASLSAIELNRHTVRALRLRKNWTLPSPVASSVVNLRTTSEPQSRIIGLEFLPGGGHRWLLSITHASNSQTFVIHCWDMQASPPTYRARYRVRNLASFAVNTDPASRAILALQLPHIEIFTINFTAANPDSAFVRIAAFPTRKRKIHKLSGNTLLTMERDRHLTVWNIHNPGREFELRNPQVPQSEPCLDAVIQGDLLILLRGTTLEFYALPSLRAAAPQDGPRSSPVHIIFQHAWLYRIHSFCVSRQVSWSGTRTRIHPPITMIFRFVGTGQRWPNNAIQHFTLPPHPYYDPSSDISINNLPYLLPPKFIQNIPSPVRLFSNSPLALGSYGTVLWVDTHTEHYFNRPGEGQRLVGAVLSSSSTRRRRHSDVGLGPGYFTGPPDTVFGVQEADGWVRLAVDEEEGRIAVGDVDGQISLRRYVR